MSALFLLLPAWLIAILAADTAFDVTECAVPPTVVAAEEQSLIYARLRRARAYWLEQGGKESYSWAAFLTAVTLTSAMPIVVGVTLGLARDSSNVGGLALAVAVVWMFAALTTVTTIGPIYLAISLWARDQRLLPGFALVLGSCLFVLFAAGGAAATMSVSSGTRLFVGALFASALLVPIFIAYAGLRHRRGPGRAIPGAVLRDVAKDIARADRMTQHGKPTRLSKTALTGFRRWLDDMSGRPIDDATSSDGRVTPVTGKP